MNQIISTIKISKAGRLILLLLLIFSLKTSIKGQQPIYSEGKDFWLALIMNEDASWNKVKIYITSEYTTSGTISIPLQGWTQTFNVAPKVLTIIELPPDLVFSSKSEVIEKKGIHVVSDCDITVWCVNTNSIYAIMGTNVLPTATIGNTPEYIAASYAGNMTNYNSEFIIVSTQDSSKIIISPTVNTLKGQAANVNFTIYLNKGETYQVMANDTGDLTGTSVRAIKGNCAVFSGVPGLFLNPDAIYCTIYNPLYQQCYPIKSWGYDFILTPFKNQDAGYIFRVIASAKNTTVNIPGQASVVLNKGQYFTKSVTNASAMYISADKPISVAQYQKSCSGNIELDNSYAGPSMLILNSNDQLQNEALFPSAATQGIDLYSQPVLIDSLQFVNIITRTANVTRIILDGNNIANSNFIPVPSLPSYSYALLKVDSGFHKLSSDSGFIAYANGLGYTAGYAYSIGGAPKKMISLYVSIKSNKNQICSEEAVTFTATATNGGASPSYQWKVNGTNAGSNSSVFSYSPNNNDTIRCVISSDYKICGVPVFPATSNALAITVNQSLPMSVSISTETNPLCEGTLISFLAIPLNGGSAPSYQWQVNSIDQGNNSPTFIYTPFNSDIVSCTLTSNETCSSGSPASSNNISMIVNSLPDANITSTSDSLCTKWSATISAGNQNSEGYIYKWSNDSITKSFTITNDNSTGSVVKNTYHVTVTDNAGCKAIDSAIVYELPDISKLYTASPDNGNTPLTVNFKYTGTDNVTWLFGDNSLPGTSKQSNTEHTYNYNSNSDPQGLGDTTYHAKIKIGRCEDSAEIIVRFVKTYKILNIPNVLTLNNDGKNDNFSIQGNGIMSAEVKIFNRWGEEIFNKTYDVSSFTFDNSSNVGSDTKNYIMWDGTNKNGHKADDGVYFYVIKPIGNDGNSITPELGKLTGTVTVIK